MWRKLGIWLWLATQNLSDFPDDAKKLLNMIEWWELLVMPPEEVEQVSRFKSLTPEQRQLPAQRHQSAGEIHRRRSAFTACGSAVPRGLPCPVAGAGDDGEA